MAPSSRGSCPRKPLRYFEDSTVDSRVTNATTTHQLLMGLASAGMASLRALPARVRPMIMATGPVMEAGKIFSTALRPQNFTKIPAAIETKPERIMPN